MVRSRLLLFLRFILGELRSRQINIFIQSSYVLLHSWKHAQICTNTEADPPTNRGRIYLLKFLSTLGAEAEYTCSNIFVF